MRQGSPIDVKVKKMGLAATEEQLVRIADRLRDIIRDRNFAAEEEVEEVVRATL